MSIVATIGNLSLDRVAGEPTRVGGAVFYAAAAGDRLGCELRVAARCADDDRATALTPLLQLGHPTWFATATRTTEFAYHYEHEVRVMDVVAAGDPWTPEDVRGWAAPALDGAVWVHVGGLLRTDFPHATLRALRGDGRMLLVDGQGLVRRAEPGPLRRDGAVDRAVLADLEVLKLSESEAGMLAGGVDEHALRALGVPEVVLTLGSAGSLVVTAGHAERVSAEPVQTQDPTGAGDTYAVAYADARARGAAPVEAAREASTLVSAVLAARR